MNTYKPILIYPAVPYKNGIRFLLPDKQLDIHGEIIDSVWKVIGYCNGHRTVSEIIKQSGIKAEIVNKIIDNLNNLKLLLDSRQLYIYFHEISSNPQPYVQILNAHEIINHQNHYERKTKKGIELNYSLNTQSSLYMLQTNRFSCRAFDKQKKITLEQLGNICDFAYSQKRHAVPSGGALFPLKIYCVVPYDQLDFPKGYYEYDHYNDKLILYEKNPDLEQLKYCYNDAQLAYGSSVQLIIAADITRQPYKYSNLGYRMTLIEVGQVAQNITMYCCEQNIETCELGGILDKALATELQMDNNSKILPILTIAIGYASKRTFSTYSQLLEKLIPDIVGDNKIVHKFGVNTFSEKSSSFFGAWATYGENKTLYSGATGVSYYEAAYKAIIEAYERAKSSYYHIDYVGIAKNDDAFLLPEKLAPLSDKQRANMGLKPYHKNDILEWTKDMSGQYYAPTDFIFYGHKKKEKLFFGNSSGIAAYTDYYNAKIRATCELIERGEIMKYWYGKKSPKHVHPKNLPIHIAKKTEYWKTENRIIEVLDLNSEYAYVFLVIIHSKNYPAFVSGSAADFYDSEKAMLKAFQEAEYNLLLSLHSPCQKPPEVENIITPLDHGRYYHFYENASKIAWLWANQETVNIQYNTIYDFENVVSLLDVKFFDLSGNSEAKLKVVRAVSIYLIPLSFGYGRDFFLHPCIENIENKDYTICKLPHFFA